MLPKMIKNVALKPFTETCELPSYVYKNVFYKYTLTATIEGDYKVVLARLITGYTNSADNILSHALFESYTDHGDKMIETKVRVDGFEREFMAAKSVMVSAGIEFEPIPPCHVSELLKGLGAYYQRQNPDIKSYAVMSQTCH